ncbi:MAG: calcium-binding protein, partial [Nitrospiraceae bacterium]
MLNLGRAIFFFADLFRGVSTDDAAQAERELINLHGIGQVPTGDIPSNTSVDSEARKALRYELATMAVASKLSTEQRAAFFANERHRSHIDALQAIGSIDVEEYTEELVSGEEWLLNSQHYLESRARASGLEGAEFLQFKLHNLSLLDQELLRFPDSQGQLTADVSQAIRKSLNEDFATALVSANTAYERPITLDRTNLFAGANYAVFVEYRDALKDALRAPEFVSIRPYLDEALAIVEAGWQTLTLASGVARNPFDDSLADPNGLPSLQLQLEEGTSRVVTAYSSSPAGSGGQRVAIQVTGQSADSLAVVVGDDTIQLDSSGAFEIVIPEGQRQASFAFWQKSDVAADDMLSVSMTLLDEAGQATHRTDIKGTIDLTAEDDFEDPVGAYTILGDQIGLSGDGHTVDEWGNVVNGTPAPGRNDFLNGSPSNDRIEGLGGSDTVNGGLGEDHILGGDGDDALAGEGGDDRIEGGEGTDLVLGGEGDDLILGGEGTESLLSGNEGNDRIYAGTEEDDETIFDSDTV